ncbi:hypothetical protein [Polaribacter cellanae]|uniref:Bacteriocin n=1 Tax=Polaribacter cellanae TaxID=2818493 RepID=A0A975CSF3_9FLAO|nr:hypothetical protein [Polaribacter cellanae]QTE22436.1 hypothetical protein J3359_16785 [Polaribacter cellanae]
MKNLQNFGVQELNAEEVKEIDGGNDVAGYLFNMSKYAVRNTLFVLGMFAGISDGFDEGNK